jgi:hypothetical protein
MSFRQAHLCVKKRGDNMIRNKKGGARRLPMWASCFAVVAMVLAVLFAPMGAKAQYEVNVGPSRALDPGFVGVNGQFHNHLKTDPWNNTFVQDLAWRMMLGTFRYPAGTGANYWDWTLGRRSDETTGQYLTSNLKVGYDATGFMPIYVLNCMTGTLQESLDALAQAQSEGLPIQYVELGNEYYLGVTDYTQTFSSGVPYGQLCQTWIPAIKAQFPGVKCGIVGTMRTATSRMSTWNAEVLSACNNYDAVIIHTYKSSAIEPAMAAAAGDWGTQTEQNSQWSAFQAADAIDIMLAQPYEEWNLLVGENDLPAGTDIWLTEFNMADTVGPTRGNWAHGLFTANQMQTFLVDGRVSRSYLHNFMTDQGKFSGFAFGTQFKPLLSNHGQGELATVKYDMNASGIVLGLMAEVMTGADTIAQLEISAAPTVSPTGYADYWGLYGWKFTAGQEDRAYIVNTSGVDYDINTANIAPAASYVRQVSGDPRTYVTGEDTLNTVTSDTLPPVLHIPAYSMTTINGPEWTPSYNPTTTFYAIDDHQVKEDTPDALGTGDQDFMVLRNMNAGLDFVDYIKFKVEGLIGTVTSATLNLHSVTVNYPVNIFSTGDLWDEMDVSWNTQPGLSSLVATSGNLVAGAWNSIDVTSATVANGLLSFGIEGAPSTGYAKLDTKEAGFSPELIVTTVNSAASFSSGTLSKPGATGHLFYEDSVAADATDPDGDKLIFSKVSGPDWISVWSDGTISGTPSNGDAGLNSLVVSVTDGAGTTDQATVEINVTSGTVPPPQSETYVFEPIGDTFASEVKPDTIMGTRITYELRDGAGVRRIAFIKFDTRGVYGTVSDAFLRIRSNSQQGQIDIWDVPDTSWGESTLTWNNMPAMGAAITSATVAQSTWHDIDLTSYFAAGPGIYSIAISTPETAYGTMDSANSANIPTLNITIGGGAPGNNPPTFNSDPIAKADATEDAAYSASIAADATDPDSDPLTYSKVSGPAWLNVAADGSLSGTPANGDVGPNSWSVRVSDGNGGTDTATLNINVINVNDAPVFSADPFSTANAEENVAYSDTISGSATDVDAGDTLTYSKVSGPAWLVVAADGALSGTPGAGDVGANVFSVKVEDAALASDTATLDITVEVAGGNPSADYANADVAGSGTVSGSYADTQASDNSYESITEVLSGGKPNSRYSFLEHKWTVNVAGGSSVIFSVEAYKTANSEGDDFVFAYSTDDVNYTDMVTVTKTADDDTTQSFTLPASVSGTVYIRVKDSDSTAGNTVLDTVYVDEMYILCSGTPPPNQAPSFSSDPVVEVNATESAAYSATLADDATDPESDPMTFSKVSGPVWLSVAADGTLSGTPGAGDVGLNSFTVQVDATGGSDTATLQITVDAAGTTLPGQASNPTPADGQQRVQNAILSWTAGSDADSHDVYFGTTSGNLTFMGSQTGTTFDPGALDSRTWYYWRIDEVNANGTTTGVEWSFKAK